MPQVSDIVPFLEFAKHYPIIDARSGGEHTQGCIPGSYLLPLLNNEERAEVGTTYKQIGREAAVLNGFELVGHKFADYIKQALAIAPNKEIGVYCWRGGMRSNIMAWLLETAGFKVTLLRGGYKNFRHHCLDMLDTPLRLIVLSGRTGSGKTELLHALKQNGEQIIDFEGLAHHKGSTFGGIGQLPQSSQEQFENVIATQLFSLDHSKPIWVEDESKSIGKLRLPNAMHNQMQNTILIDIQVPHNERLDRVVAEYGSLPKEQLIESTLQLTKRMGGQHVKEAVERLNENNTKAWADKLLVYYDKNYDFGKSRKKPENIRPIFLTGDINEMVVQLLETMRQAQTHHSKQED